MILSCIILKWPWSSNWHIFSMMPTYPSEFESQDYRNYTLKVQKSSKKHLPAWTKSSS